MYPRMVIETECGRTFQIVTSNTTGTWMSESLSYTIRTENNTSISITNGLDGSTNATIEETTPLA